MKQNLQHNSTALAVKVLCSDSARKASEGIDSYQRIEEKELLLSFITTMKDSNLTDQQAVTQLTALTENVTAAATAQAAHKLQMDLLDYVDEIVKQQ